MQDRIFYLSCFGFVLGVLVRSFIAINIYAILFFVCLSLALLLFFFISKNNFGIIIFCAVLALCIGIWRFDYVDKPVLVLTSGEHTGIIVDDPDIRENNQKLTIKTEETKILVTAGLEERYQYGDKIKFSGNIERPENFITDQGKEFDYINYLRKDGITHLVFYPDIEIISRDGGSVVKRVLFFIKTTLLEKINLSIREPESLLMGGLILGERSAFDESLRRALVDTGTIHIVALSGYNVTIVAEWIMKIFSFLPANFAFGAGIIGILLFVVMAGGGSTAVRAGIMASLALVARSTGRNYDVARALILAGVIMVLINPFVLVFDVSFQLSFIATVAVIFFAPKIEKYFSWVPKRWKLRDIISVTFAAYIFVLPFILYKMGNLSIVALPANILILPFIPITMLLGFLTSVAGIIWYVLAAPFGFLSYVLLHYELMVVDFFSRVPFAALSIPNFPLSITILIYVYFIYRLFGRNIKSFLTEPF